MHDAHEIGSDTPPHPAELTSETASEDASENKKAAEGGRPCSEGDDATTE
jgi:hypothetical protein